MNNRIVVVNLNSTTNISIIGSGPGNDTNQFNELHDIFVTNTSLYVLDYLNYRVQKTSLNGSNPSTVLGFSGLASPFYFYVDNNDNIYLSVLFGIMVYSTLKKNFEIIYLFVGICNETSKTTFICECAPGWQDIHCETKINYCEKVNCLNNGVCQSLLLNYTCQCLGDSYSGRYCEITSNTLIIHQVVAKSFAYIAILAMISVVMFVVILDVLKYFFGIDPVDRTRKKLQSTKRKKDVERKKSVNAIRFIYVNASPKDHL